jgi:hypothetical protein
LRGSVFDESKSELKLRNGSRIIAVPASSAQIRGWPVDVLIVDEAGFLPSDVWQAAEPAIIARPGSKVVLASSPNGASDHFFRVLWKLGMTAPDDQVRSWHWPSSISPMVDDELLASIEARESPLYFRREYLAEWDDAQGAFFTTEEIDANLADYELIDPPRSVGQPVAGGLDWGQQADANTLVLLGVLSDGELNDKRHPTEPVFFVAHAQEHYRMPYATFVDRIVDVADEVKGGFDLLYLASETNGVGQAPTDMLIRQLWERQWSQRVRTRVAPVHTDNRRKESMFGTVKLLLQQGRLVLPVHPNLIRQMRSLEFSTTERGNTRIEVPTRLGHDDLVMALGQAASCVRVSVNARPEFAQLGTGDVLITGSGTKIHQRPRCAYPPAWALTPPQGRETGDGW